MSNILIVTDLEGIRGVSVKNPIKDETSLAYKNACEQLMHETNLAVSALIDAGASLVYVFDGHASGKNFIPNTLDGRAVQIWGKDLSWVMDEVEGFVMIGAHAMAGNEKAFFSHTFMWEEFKSYRINGKAIGETADMGIYAGMFDVPCIAVTGDDHACREAEDFYSGVATAAVKTAVSRDEAIPLSQDEADKLIYSAMVNGYEKRHKIKPLKVEFPLTVEVDFSTEKDLEKWCGARTDIIRDNLNVKCVKQKESIKGYYDLLL